MSASWLPVRQAPKVMTRCECSGVTFVEVAYRVQYEGLPLHEATRQTGCGETCTACRPDLEAFLREKGLLGSSG